MEKKKVLFVIAGGRATPDVLALFYVQPQVVVYLTSEEGWSDEEAFVHIAESMLIIEHIYPIRNVSAYNFESATQACLMACAAYPETEWDVTFTIGSGPKLSSIAAYEVAKQKKVPCLFIDTPHETIISLTTPTKLPEVNLFHLSVEDYMRIQHRTYQQHHYKTAMYRTIAEAWGDMARTVACSADGPQFTLLMHDYINNEYKLGLPATLPHALATSPLLQELWNTYHVIDITTDERGEECCTFTSDEAAHFLSTGDWLEVYVWYEAVQAAFADDCRWGYQIANGKAQNELDLALTYKAQLVIGECKTDKNPFKQKRVYLDTLDSNAHLLGGNYVTKLFITHQPRTLEGYTPFKEQADKRHIVVLIAEDMPQIGATLKREALTPTFPRR